MYVLNVANLCCWLLLLSTRCVLFKHIAILIKSTLFCFHKRTYSCNLYATWKKKKRQICQVLQTPPTLGIYTLWNMEWDKFWNAHLIKQNAVHGGFVSFSQEKLTQKPYLCFPRAFWILPVCWLTSCCWKYSSTLVSSDGFSCRPLLLCVEKPGSFFSC